MRQFCFSMIVVLAAGCASPQETERRVTFSCENGEVVEVHFMPKTGIAGLLRNGDSMELKQQPVASGFHYTNGPYAIRGKGDELIVEVGRMTPLKCTAKRA